jgi:cytochrome c556
MIRRALVLAVAACAVAAPAIATEDAIATRQALMSANAAAAGVSVAMIRNEMPYSPVAAQAAIRALHAGGMAFGDYFPEGSEIGGDTTAAPAVWEDPDGFAAALQEFNDAIDAALAAAGDEGPADLASFQAAMQPVLATCRDCHETYRVED